jgi:hypothetical protein
MLPPALRAIALSLLIETVVPLLKRSPEGSLGLSGLSEGGADGKGSSWDLLRCKCDELSALVLRSNNPGEAAGDVLAYLPKRFEHVFEQLLGSERTALLARVESVHQGNGKGAGVAAESWDSPFEPRCAIRFHRNGHRAKAAE